MLESHGIAFRYREYREERLDEGEIRTLLDKLGMGPHDLLRRKDRAFRELALTGEENDDALIALMAEHPTLLQRPIGVSGARAILGRPPENLLDLAR